MRTLSWVRTFTPYIEDALKERPTEVTGNGYRLTNLLTYDGLKGRLTLLMLLDALFERLLFTVESD